MSFTPVFTPETREAFGSLEFELQELVLDELDRLCLNPPPHGEHIVAVDHLSPNSRVIVFLRAHVDHAHETVEIANLGRAILPLPG